MDSAFNFWKLHDASFIYVQSCCGFTTLHLKGAGPLQDELLVL